MAWPGGNQCNTWITELPAAMAATTLLANRRTAASGAPLRSPQLQVGRVRSSPWPGWVLAVGLPHPTFPAPAAQGGL
jgi:hypothetical protein